MATLSVVERIRKNRLISVIVIADAAQAAVEKEA
jgi:hypothetical protein